MRFLYVAPRYHTNQVNIMKGLIEQGNEVCFISHYQGKTEDYSDVRPVVLGYSIFYQLIDFLYVKVIRRKDANAVLLKVRYGFPPFRKLSKLIRAFRPDIAIVREKSLYSIAAYRICKRLGCPCILYNQTPLWSEPAKTDFAHRIADRFSPKMRMTPVMGTEEPGLTIKGNDFYIPFVAKPQTAPQERTYFENGIIRILCIGKFEVRKHHLELLEAVEKLRGKYPLHLTIIGEVSTQFQKEHYERVKNYIREHDMESFVTLKTNLPRKDMDAEYRNADAYVIPSTGEPASVSQLEAMSFSLPVICSDKNGTACYVEDGVTGYLFRDCNQEDLEKKLDMLLSDKEKLLAMGAAGYKAVVEQYGFARYYDGIMEIWKKIKADGNRS